VNRLTQTARPRRPHGAARRGAALGLLTLAAAGLAVAMSGTAGPTPAPPPCSTVPPHSLAAQPPGTFALRARAVYPVTPDQPGPIDRGVVLVRAGKIVAVGADLAIPADIPVIDLRDEIVCPGFVAAGSGLAGAHAGPHSLSAAYHAVDAYDPYGEYELPLARGITTAHLDPGTHRLVSGVGASVKLAGPPETRVLAEAADLCVTFGVFGPPPVVERPFYASSDVPIEPARLQRPESRLGQFVELNERIAAARAWLAQPSAAPDAKYDVHAESFAAAWQAELPLRIEVHRAADIEGALGWLKELAATPAASRSAYLVGLTEGDGLAAALATAGVPLVVRVDAEYRRPGQNIGPDPDAYAPGLGTAARIISAATAAGTRGDLRLALAGKAGDAAENPRMSALLAVRGGLDANTALAAITRVPAEILGLGDRVGSLAPGKDADLLVLTGPPLDIHSHVRRVYADGRVVFEMPRAATTQPTSAPADRANDEPAPLVVRAGAIWVNAERLLTGTAGGRVELLIEHGKIQAVGARVPHPPFAKIVDAGPTAFVTPGFIDAYGHLGLSGDQTVATPDVPIHKTIAVAGREFARVARAGVTTVLLAPYRGAPNGARVAAIKTWGTGRDELVARELSGVRFSLRGQDPVGGVEPLRRTLQAGQKYVETWKKYEEELAKWKQGGGKPEAKPKEETPAPGEPGKIDPITGTWQYTLSGEPLPDKVTGSVVLRLTGTTIEGRLTDPESGEEVHLTGTLSGNDITMEVDAETPLGKPTIRATLDREDHMTGRLGVGEFGVHFEAERTEKGPVEFKVQLARKKSKDGRPTPPKVDENLEPLRTLLAGRVPAVVEVESAAQIAAAVKLFVDDFKVPLVLVGAEDAAPAAERLVACRDKLGVVVSTEVLRNVIGQAGTNSRAGPLYNPAADLSRRGLHVALQSNSEDAARNLPHMALFAVREGLGGDAALQALTVDAARMYKLDDRLGTLEPGKDGDVLIFSGHPFDADARLERVIVGGREVPDEQ
jgi:imidazolonepropionase-like amidohydrolase